MSFESLVSCRSFFRECLESLKLFGNEFRRCSPSSVALYGEDGRFFPDFILWLRNSKEKRTLVRFVEPHGLHHESENKAKNKAQCLKHLLDLSKHEAFKKKGVELDGWILSATDKISDIPWAGKRGWPELKREFKVLSMTEVYVPIVLNFSQPTKK